MFSRRQDPATAGLKKSGVIEYNGKRWRKVCVMGVGRDKTVHFDAATEPGEPRDHSILRLPFSEYRHLR